LSNAYRHAGVTEQRVRLLCNSGDVVLQIIDNGRGFEPPPLDGPKGTEREEHIGLRRKRDPVKPMGGTITHVMQPGKGTAITVKIPNREVKPGQVRKEKDGDKWANQFE